MNETILRQWSMLRHIPRIPRKTSAPMLLTRLEDDGFKTSLRTIQRDLNLLAISFPLQSDDAKPQGWSWSKDSLQFDLPAQDYRTAISFTLAQAHLDQVLPDSTVDYLKPWFKSAESVLDNSSPKSGHWGNKFRIVSRSISLLSPRVDDDVQSSVYECLLEEKRIEITYKARNTISAKDYIVHPLATVIVDSVCYLICMIGDHEDIRQLAMHRILKATPTTIRIKVKKGFDIDTYIGSGNIALIKNTGKIKLKFLMKSNSAFHLHETPLSTDQLIVEKDKEWTSVSASVNDTGQLRWWLRAFGPDLIVLEPKSLKAEFVKDSLLTAKHYHNSR